MGSMTVGWLVHRVKGDAREFLGTIRRERKRRPISQFSLDPGLKAGRSRASRS